MEKNTNNTVTLKEKKRADNVITLENVVKVFDGITVVDSISLAVKRGEFVTLLGPSGCGKTTLLRMIAGFETPTSGRILLENTDVTNMPAHLRPVNTVFQKYALFPHLNVYKNIAFGLKLKRLPTGEFDKKGREIFRKYTRSEIDEKVSRALKIVNLESYGYRDVAGLSGGQQQRVAIARAIVCEPKVLLLDEPLGALDLKMRKEMQIELSDMHRRLGITFLYVTHDQEEALTMSDKIAVMTDGAVQQYGAPKSIYDEPSNAFVADFIGESNIISGIMRRDELVSFCGADFVCADKGFAPDEKVDLVIRPEDIEIGNRGALEGIVTASVFKGMYYEMTVTVNGYEFTVQSPKSAAVGSKVKLNIDADGIHIMKKVKQINSYEGSVSGENTVTFCGGEFEFINERNLPVGTRVSVRVAFDKVELQDDEADGIIGANVTASLYKGTYYQVQVYTDDDNDFLVDTSDEWDMDDRVGISIKAKDIIVEPIEESSDNLNGENSTDLTSDNSDKNDPVVEAAKLPFEESV